MEPRNPDAADHTTHALPRRRTTFEFRRDPKDGREVTLRLESLAGDEFACFVWRVTNP